MNKPILDARAAIVLVIGFTAAAIAHNAGPDAIKFAAQFWSEVANENRYSLLLMGACWLFAVATFANIFLTGQTHLLDRRGDEFFKHFPGLLIATGMIMVLTTYLVAAVIAKFVIYALSYWQIV